jgi:hypothetical protein
LKNKLVYIISLVFLVQIGCKEKPEPDSQQMDREKTNELLGLIINDSTDLYTASSCISERNKLYHVIMTTDLPNFLKTELGIKDKEHLKRQLELYKTFKLNENLAVGKKIITEKEFKEFSDQAEKGNHILYPWLNSNCENGYLSLSKPVFNDTYDKALVTIGTICGGKCGSGETRTYEFLNGKWTIVKTEFEWIS